MARLAQAVEDGVLSPVVSATLPLAQAHEMLDDDHTRGKIVLTVAE